MEKELIKVKKVAVEFFDHLGLKPEVKVEALPEGAKIEISGEDLGMLIGYHGEALEALQLLLGLIVNKQLGRPEWLRVVLDVGGWRAEREEVLRKLTTDAIEKASTSDQKIDLPPMSASQRRFVHLLVQEHPELTSFSEGFGAERHIVISKNQ